MAKLALISNGPPFFIQPFREETGYQGELYTDPSLESYKLLNFKRGLSTLMGFKSIKESLRAATTGYGQISVQGDTQQQGGVLVIGPGDQLHYVYRNQEAGDHAPMADVLAACQ